MLGNKHYSYLHSVALARLIIQDEAIETGQIDESLIDAKWDELEEKSKTNGFEVLGYMLDYYKRDDGTEQSEKFLY